MLDGMTKTISVGECSVTLLEVASQERGAEQLAGIFGDVERAEIERELPAGGSISWSYTLSLIEAAGERTLVDTGFGFRESSNGTPTARLLESVNITTNKNLIPFDKQSPFVTSGLRLGTPALTTRGMRTEQMVQIADMITDLLRNPESSRIADDVRRQVSEITKKFPLYKL